MRTSLASLLVLVGCLLTFPAAFALWEQREVRDEAHFVSLGEDVLSKQPVQQAVADSISGEVRDIVRQNVSDPPPDSVIDAVTLNAVTNLSQSHVAADALRDTHRLLVRIADLNDDGRGPVEQDNGTLVLDLRAVVQNVLQDTQVLDPTMRGRIVVPPDTGRIVIVRDKDIELAITLVRNLDHGARILIILPFIAYGLALLVAPNRGLALFVIGASVAGAAVVRFILLKGPLASLLRDLLARTPTTQSAGLATYDTFVASFGHQDQIVLIGGAAVAVVGVLFAVLMYRP